MGGALVAASAGLVLYAWSKGESAATATPLATIRSTPALTVTVARAGMRPMHAVALATGTVVAWEDLIVAAEAAGLTIVEVLVDEGDQVAQGQLLARLDDRQLQAQIDQQEASIVEAQANLESAQAELRRGQDLAGSNVISRQDAEQRATDAKVMQARLGVARAELARLQAQLTQTLILAPADGYVSKRSGVIGQVVQIGTELFRVVRGGRLEVDASVPEAALLGIAPGQYARITDPAGRIIDARVRAVAPLVDAETRLGIVHAALPAN